MFCKTFRSTRVNVVLLFVGVVLAVFGIINAINLPESAHNASRIAGIFTGMGSAFVAVSAIKLIHQKRTAPEKLKEEQIALKDERNVQILRVAYTISNVVAALMLAGLVFIFSAIGSVTESYFCLGALLIQQVAFFTAYKYYCKKM